MTDEVLPSIHTHGGYIKDQEKPEMTESELMARALLVAQSVIDTKNKQIVAKDETIAIMAPKAAAADALIIAEGTMTWSEVAKTLGMRQCDLMDEEPEALPNFGWGPTATETAKSAGAIQERRTPPTHQRYESITSN